MSYIRQEHSITCPDRARERRYSAAHETGYQLTSVTPEAATGSYLFMYRLLLENSVLQTNKHAVIAFLPAGEPRDLLSDFEDYTFPNWDNEGAAPIGGDTLLVARRILSMLPSRLRDPEAAPGADGSVCLEWLWNKDGRRVFIDVGPKTRVAVYARLGDAERFEADFPDFSAHAKSYISGIFKRVDVE